MGVSPGFPPALKTETVTMNVSSSGSAATISGSANFANTYSSTPLILFAYWSTTIGYVNVTFEPFIHNQSTTGFSCDWSLQSPNVFGAGTGVAKFFVIGS